MTVELFGEHLVVANEATERIKSLIAKPIAKSAMVAGEIFPAPEHDVDDEIHLIAS